jgi:hypothetical protein
MTAPTEDRVKIDEEIKEVTQEEAEKDPLLRADPTTAKEGVLDDEDPVKFEARELEAAEDLIVTDEESEGGGAGGAPISPHQRRALMLAVSQKGMREEPKGSNNNQYSRYFGFGPQFWCADFVAFCVDKTGNRDRKVPWGYPSGVRNITAWGKRNGTIHSQPRAGDIFTLKPDVHTGLVVSAQGSSFTTIEGNTSGPGGDFYVASHARDASSGMYFFIRDDLADA